MASLLAVAPAVASDPRSTYTLSMADGWYPRRACVFLEQTGLRRERLYNDVRFGGYLLYRYYPPHQVFIDDRNEIHEPLLTEIYEIYQTRDADAFSALLDRYGLDTALVRYNPPFAVHSPSGEALGWRGYSALWFPSREWSLVYWDDVAMVFVRRRSEAATRLANLESRLIRPDDLSWLRERLASDPSLAPLVAAEAARKLTDEPDCARAREVASWLVPAAAP